MYLLVILLGLMIFLIDWARKPEHWKWFEVLTAPPRDAPLDNRLDPAAADEAGDVIRIRAVEEPGAAGSGAAAEPDHAGRSSPPSGALPEVPGVNRKYLAEVRDDTPTRRAEQDARFQLWDVLLRLRPAELQKLSVGRVSYVQLFRQSDVYRGKLIHTQGTVRRTYRVKAPKNAVGIESYYEIWLAPRDNPSSPMIVDCLKLPKQFPTGVDLAEEVALTGFFFKRRAYDAWDPYRKETTRRTAPVVLSKGLQWHKRPPPAQKTSMDVATVGLIVGATLASSLLVAWYVYARTRRPKRTTNELRLFD